jgi:hypothetical protein
MMCNHTLLLFWNSLLDPIALPTIWGDGGDLVSLNNLYVGLWIQLGFGYAMMGQKDEAAHLHQFILHASLDIVQDVVWTTNAM